MNVTEFLEKWGRTLFESPLARTAPLESPPELAEIRFAVLDEVRRNSYRAGARQVFPYDLVRVSMRGVEESRAAVFRSGFFRQYLEQEIQGSLRADRRALSRAAARGRRCRDRPAAAERALADGGRRIAGAGRARRSSRPGWWYGRAARIRRSCRSTKPRVHIGREVDVYRNGGMHRRNDLAFVEDSEVNRSVSREHAHIDYDRTTGEYRLFNDRWYERGHRLRHAHRARRREHRGASRYAGHEAGIGR